MWEAASALGRYECGVDALDRHECPATTSRGRGLGSGREASDGPGVANAYVAAVRTPAKSPLVCSKTDIRTSSRTVGKPRWMATHAGVLRVRVGDAVRASPRESCVLLSILPRTIIIFQKPPRAIYDPQTFGIIILSKANHYSKSYDFMCTCAPFSRRYVNASLNLIILTTHFSSCG
jgi:hypothetical protein